MEWLTTWIAHELNCLMLSHLSLDLVSIFLILFTFKCHEVASTLTQSEHFWNFQRMNTSSEFQLKGKNRIQQSQLHLFDYKFVATLIHCLLLQKNHLNKAKWQSIHLTIHNQRVLVECIRFQVRINRNSSCVIALTDLDEGFRVANEFSAS